MQTLRRGSRGVQVEYLQGRLNTAARRDGVGGAVLSMDGDFGPLTDAALRAYQGRNGPLKVDGVAGMNTWTRLGVRTEAEHNRVILFGQPTGMTCWSAAATMILGNQSVGSGNATTGPGGGLTPTSDNQEVFARALGWRMLGYSPTVTDLANIVRQKPVWISAYGSTWAHAVVLSGVYSDGNDAGDGTMFRIHDPWPVGRGRIYGSLSNPLTFFDASGVNRVQASLQHILIPN